jgi:hypothetical protein
MNRLHPDDLRALAQLVATELAETVGVRSFVAAPADVSKPSAHLVDAAELARILSVSRRYVYEHRDELACVALGSGKKPRLRFDVEVARGRFACLSSKRSPDVNSRDPASADGQGRAMSGRRSVRKVARLPLGLPEPGSILRSRPREGSTRAA